MKKTSRIKQTGLRTNLIAYNFDRCKKVIFTPLIIFLLIFLVCGKAVTAQENPLKLEYSYRRYTTADGLPSMDNSCLLQDSKGFIWIAGVWGIVRFDGFKFKNYLSEQLANIFRLDHDKNGNVRAFTNNLMYSIDKNDALVCTLMPDSCRLTINSSRNLPDGYYVYQVNGKNTLYTIRNDSLEKMVGYDDFDNGLDNNSIYFDPQSGELYLPNDSSIIIVAKNDVFSYDGIFAGAFCKYKNKVIALAEDGIYSLHHGKAECLLKQSINVYEGHNKIYVDDEGVIFFNTIDNFCRYKNNCLDTLFTATGIMDFLIDSNKSIWINTYNGLYNLFKMKFQYYTLPDKEDVVKTIAYNPHKKTITAGTLNGKLYEISEKKYKQIHYPESPFKSAYFHDYSLITDDGTIYLPSVCDILMLKNNQGRWLNHDLIISPLFIATLPDGNLLHGKGKQAFSFTRQGKLLREFGKQNFGQSVYAKPCIDKQSRLWLGGYDGITIYDYANDSIVKTIFNKQTSSVKYMNKDNEGNVWFASDNHLFVSDNDTIRLEKTIEHHILGIFFTRNDLLVISTLGGIYIFDKNRENYTFYNHENGYTGLEPSSAAMAEDADGNVYLPSKAGLFFFNPEKLMYDMYDQPRPRLHLLSTATSTNNIAWERADTNLKLDHRHVNVRFEYIGLSYTSAQNVRYRYRLRGFQNDWSEPVKTREITFNNLPPGDYVFEIYADAGTNESRSEIQSLAFSITPAFWQTTWFLVASAAFLMLASAGFALYLQRRKNKVLLEKLRAEKELNELRISGIRLKAIPHFNANVLAAIEYYIANRTKEEAMRILGIYSDFTLKTLSEVDKAARPLSEELAYVKMYLDLEKIRFMEKFDFQIDVDDEVDKSVQLPNMILHTYCENAVKHGLMPRKSGGLLVIRVSQRDRTVCVSVEDNGVGRVYSGQNPHVHSTKQGLSILNRQVEIYNRFNHEKISQRIDDLAADDGQSAGTRFTVEIPLDFTYIN